MACLNIQEGDFSLASSWSSSDSDSTAGGTVTITRSVSNLVISKGGDSAFFGVNSLFTKVGTNFLFILHKLSDVTGITRSVSVVDTSGAGLSTQIVVGLYSGSNATADPLIHLSSGNNNAFMVETFGMERRLHGFFRSDNGNVIEGIPFNSVSTTGAARVSSGNMQYSLGGSWITAGPLPTGSCSVSPASRTFADAIVGADIAGLDSSVESFTLENIGTDCLLINSIGSVGPFSVISTIPATPVTLDPSESISVDVRFAPGSIDDFDEDLPIIPTPTIGHTVLNCKGESKPAVTSITFSGSLGFGTEPVGSSDVESATIQNNGQRDITLNIPASNPTDAPFSWPAFNGVLAPTASQLLNVTFGPTAEGMASGTINFTGSDPDSPHQISLNGTGCVAYAEMQVETPNPMDPYIDFGEVQRGFRTVRVIKILNSGDGPLNFSARIEGTDATLFGIQKEGTSIITPTSPETFTVLPVSSCSGSSGSGEVFFGITFFANEAPPKTAQAQLVIYNHNATNAIPIQITKDLQVEIIAPISVDISLVMDRSGSMSETSGDRTKIATAIDAGQLLVELMRPDVEDRLGIVRFNDIPEVVSSITDVTALNKPTLANQINSSTFDATGGTSVAGGVRVAIKDINDNPRAIAPDALNTAIVVLTDGFDNVPYDDPDGNTYSLLGEDGTTALPVPTGKRVYAVGIGDNIDTGRLSTLAQATGGQYLPILNFSGNDYFALEKHFTQIFMEAVDLSMVYDPVFTIQPNDQHVIPIDVLDGDTGLMVVVYDRDGIRLPFFLETPNGETIDLTNVPAGFQIRPGITSTARFMEVKFPIGETHRYGKQWKFIIQHDGRACVYRPQQDIDISHGITQTGGFDLEDFGPGFQPTKCKEGYDKPVMYGVAVGVGSDFRMIPYVQPGIIKIGESINLNAVLSEFGLPVLGNTVTVKVETPGGSTYNYTLLDEGNHADDDANDGNYGKVFTQTLEEGHYTFYFRATGYNHDGQSVIREAVRSKYLEGNEPLIPARDSNSGDSIKDCCRILSYFLWAIIILLLLLIIMRLIG
jgi:hypothetical protein